MEQLTISTQLTAAMSEDDEKSFGSGNSADVFLEARESFENDEQKSEDFNTSTTTATTTITTTTLTTLAAKIESPLLVLNSNSSEVLEFSSSPSISLEKTKTANTFTSSSSSSSSFSSFSSFSPAATLAATVTATTTTTTTTAEITKTTPIAPTTTARGYIPSNTEFLMSDSLADHLYSGTKNKPIEYDTDEHCTEEGSEESSHKIIEGYHVNPILDTDGFNENYYSENNFNNNNNNNDSNNNLEDEVQPFSLINLLNPYESRVARAIIAWERQEEKGRGGQQSSSKLRISHNPTIPPSTSSTSVMSSNSAMQQPTPRQEEQQEEKGKEKEKEKENQSTLSWMLGWLNTGSITETTTKAIYDCLIKIESLALDTVSIQALHHSMMMYAANKKLAHIHSPHDFHKFTLEQLDEIANSYVNPSCIASVVQGAGLGLGGLFFMTADIPLLLALNCRVLAQLGYIYGGQYFTKPSLVLHLLVTSCASMISEIRKDAAVAHSTAHDIAAEIQRQVSLESLKKDVVGDVERGIMTELVKNISIFLAAHFTRSKLLQLIPLVGVAIGAGSNYYFTATCVRNAQMNLRRQFLDRVFGMDAVRACLDAQDDEDFAWTMVGFEEVESSAAHKGSERIPLNHNDDDDNDDDDDDVYTSNSSYSPHHHHHHNHHHNHNHQENDLSTDLSNSSGLLVWDVAIEQRDKSLSSEVVEKQLADSLHKVEEQFLTNTSSASTPSFPFKENHNLLNDSYTSATAEKL